MPCGPARKRPHLSWRLATARADAMPTLSLYPARPPSVHDYPATRTYREPRPTMTADAPAATRARQIAAMPHSPIGPHVRPSSAPPPHTRARTRTAGPQAVIMRVVHIAPGPTPTFTMSAPALPAADGRPRTRRCRRHGTTATPSAPAAAVEHPLLVPCAVSRRAHRCRLSSSAALACDVGRSLSRSQRQRAVPPTSRPRTGRERHRNAAVLVRTPTAAGPVDAGGQPPISQRRPTRTAFCGDGVSGKVAPGTTSLAATA